MYFVCLIQLLLPNQINHHHYLIRGGVIDDQTDFQGTLSGGNFVSARGALNELYQIRQELTPIKSP